MVGYSLAPFQNPGFTPVYTILKETYVSAVTSTDRVCRWAKATSTGITKHVSIRSTVLFSQHSGQSSCHKEAKVISVLAPLYAFMLEINLNLL